MPGYYLAPLIKALLTYLLKDPCLVITTLHWSPTRMCSHCEGPKWRLLHVIGKQRRAFKAGSKPRQCTRERQQSGSGEELKEGRMWREGGTEEPRSSDWSHSTCSKEHQEETDLVHNGPWQRRQKSNKQA